MIASDKYFVQLLLANFPDPGDRSPNAPFKLLSPAEVKKVFEKLTERDAAGYPGFEITERVV